MAGTRPGALDLVHRAFKVDQLDALWVGDGKTIHTGEGHLYLDTVEDMCSRRLIGFALGEHHDAELATAALQMALAVRGGSADGVVFHSDQGSEYTARHFRIACERMGVHQSMGRVGSALDNAAAESFNSTLEMELLKRRVFTTRAQARREVAGFIDGFYNTRRRHSRLKVDGLTVSPVAFEVDWRNRTAQADRQADRQADEEAA